MKNRNLNKDLEATWEISFDSYYPYCTSCHFEPTTEMLSNIEACTVCPNCGRKMLNPELIYRGKKVAKQEFCTNITCNNCDDNICNNLAGSCPEKQTLEQNYIKVRNSLRLEAIFDLYQAFKAGLDILPTIDKSSVLGLFKELISKDFLK